MQSVISKWWNNLCYGYNNKNLFLDNRVKIVVIGGGTGLSNLLRGLKHYSENITAIVAVTDDGSSSGMLKKEFDILPPGDIRKCISALAHDESLVSEIMEYRFVEGKKLLGHTVGNIWITALSKRFGSFERAIEITTKIFNTAGTVLPATLDKNDLCAEYSDRSKKKGESKIAQAGKKIVRVSLTNPKARGYKKAVLAISGADLIIFGPGSLYTSVIPNLLIKDINEAVRANTKSVNLFICNCSTERGETEEYTVSDHIQAVFDHCRGKAFDYCLVNKTLVRKSNDDSVLGGINNITTKENDILGCKVIRADLIKRNNPLYHDPSKLAKNIVLLYNGLKGRS